MKEEGDINRYIRIKLYEARLAAGFTLDDLGQKIGVTGQQVFKYEKGTNQISISRLLKVIEVLSLSLDYFLGDIKPVELDERTAKARNLCLNVSNNFAKIKDRECQKILSDLIKILAEKA